MKSLIKSILIYLPLSMLSLSAVAINLPEVRFHDEHSDTLKIAELLDRASTQKLQSPNAWVSYFANQLTGTPYKEATLEGTPEMLTIDMSEFDCTTFVETVLALALTAEERRWSWRDFIHNLQQLRYRGGNIDGYSSRLHYMSDWVIDNTSMGFVRDYTSAVGNANYIVKSLDFMTEHRDSYPALSDSTEYARMKTRENAYRGHRYPYIKKSGVKGAQLRDGDIVMLVTSAKGLDVSHIGLITMKDKTPYLLHASSKAGKVVIDPLPLTEYLRKQTSTQGIRVIRLIN